MKIGLALSGGGARGIAHIGVIKALEEIGAEISCISGTSMGAIVAALYAYGYKPDEIFSIVKEAPIFRFIRPSWNWSSLLSLDGLERVLFGHMPKNNFHSLRMPLSIAATEIRKAERHYFIEGKLTSAVSSSCAVPGLFKPVHRNGGVYVDGGLLDNLPTTAIKYQCDFVIGSHCNPIDKKFKFQGSNLKAMVERSMVIIGSMGISKSKNMCDLFIEPPPLDQFSGFEMSKAQDIFDIGYAFTKNNYSIRNFRKKQ